MLRIDLQSRITNHSVLRLEHTTMTVKEIWQFLPPFLALHPELTTLSVSTLFIGDIGAKIIANILHAHPNITTLDASNNQISCEGAIALANVHSIERLNLNRNQVNLAGVQALAQNRALQYLDLTMNPTSRLHHAEALANSKSLIKLLIHFSDDNPQGDAIAKAIATCTSIQSLEISHSHIGDEGAEALAMMPNLVELCADSNKISVRGVTALAACQTLQHLSLGNNQLNDECARILALAKLTHLHVSRNNITSAGLELLASNPHIVTLNMECLSNSGSLLLSIQNNRNPIARANMGRKHQLNSTVPSLQKLCLFAIEENSVVNDTCLDLRYSQ